MAILKHKYILIQSLIMLNWSFETFLRMLCLILLLSGNDLINVLCHNRDGPIIVSKVIPISENKFENSYTDTQKQILTVSQRAEGCIEIDGLCLQPTDVASYEAIKSLHAHLDDDQSGDIDLSESVDFLRQELNYTKGFEKRQKAFHHNDDQHISVQELWSNWQSNEVHNWTVEHVVAWLISSVELGQYAEMFYENAINGSMLPRLATNNDQYLTRILGIKNPTHRSKIGIKAMDIVLFGPPKDTGSLVKDMFILSLLAFITILSYKFLTMRKRNEVLFKKMDHDMESLQEELMKFHGEKKNNDVDTKKKTSIIAEDQELDEDTPLHEMDRYDEDDNSQSGNYYWDEKSNHMSMSATDLDIMSKSKLELWLQLTYEREKIAFSNKIEDTKRQLCEARERYDRLKPNKKNFFGALSFIHGNIESKGQPITEAQHAIEEIKRMSEEMKFRWQAIEDLLEVKIMTNHGLAKLELILEPNLQRFSRAPSATVVQQLLKSQSALMFLTMGGFYSGNAGSCDLVKGSSVSTRSIAAESLRSSSMTSRSTNVDSLRGSSVSSKSVKSTTSEEGNSHRRPPFIRRNTSTSMLSDLETESATNGSVRFSRPSPHPNSLQQSHTVGSDLNHYKSVSGNLRSSSVENKHTKSLETSTPDVRLNEISSVDCTEKDKHVNKSVLKPAVSNSSTLLGSQTTLIESKEDLDDSTGLRSSPSKNSIRFVSGTSLDSVKSDSSSIVNGSSSRAKKYSSAKFFSKLGIRGKSEKIKKSGNI